VSIVIRSRGPGGVLAALKSASRQTWPNVEVIVVDTTGHPDSVWPEWTAPHPIRWISFGHKLSDAQAGNAGLDAAEGEFVCFLDDNGYYEPGHVAALADAARRDAQPLVFYAPCRSAHPGDPVIGRRLNRAVFFHDELFCLQAALIRRRVLQLGCRFDEELELGSDHDFLEQVALHGEFVFLPHVAPMIRSRQSEADAAPGARTAVAVQRIYFDNLRFAKWSGERLYHSLRAAHQCVRADAILTAGDAGRARRAFEDVLAAYPGDPDALHGLARCALASGELAAARRHIDEAIEFDPNHAQYRRTAALIPPHGGAHGDAFQLTPGGALHARVVVDPGAGGTALAPPIVVVTGHDAGTPRAAACPCGSSKRFKHCCGRETLRSAAVADDPHASETVVAQARRLLRAGEGNRAAALLARLAPQELANGRVACDAAQVYLDLHLLQPALALFQRALELGADQRTVTEACDECCHLMFRTTAWRSAGRTLRGMLDRLKRAAAARPQQPPGAIHIVCKLDTVGGTEQRALNLYRCLAGHAAVTLWSTTPALATYRDSAPVRRIAPGEAPSGGTLVLIGTYFACGDWIETAPFDRVVICHNLAEQYAGLMERMIQIEENPHRPRADLVFPSALFRDTVGLDGPVEYASIDTNLFRRRAPRAHAGTAMVVGRHGRAYALKFHPNDAAFFRALQGRGHRVRILGGTPLADAFADDSGATPELLAVDEIPVRDFLETLDVFVYRKHPRFFETGGTAILEAMAMEIPVVVFPEQCGIAELIEDGRNGFIVHSEAQALECIDRLAADGMLREQVGRAARATIVDLMERQAPVTREFYLEGNGGVAHASGAATGLGARLRAWLRGLPPERWAGEKSP